MNDQERNLEYLREAVKPSTRIFTQTEYRNGTRHVRVFISERRNSIRAITWIVGKACGLQPRSPGDKAAYLTVGGSGYSAGLHVFLAIRRVLGQPDDQATWTEL